MQEQHLFSSAILNTARIGFSRGGYFFTGIARPIFRDGWADSPIGAVVIGGGTASNGASQISLAGTNAGATLRAVRNLFTYDDHIAVAHGIHEFSAGIWFQRVEANDNLAQDQYGQASFGSLASFLQGTVSTFTVAPSPTPLGWRSLEAAGLCSRHDQAEKEPGCACGIPVRIDQRLERIARARCQLRFRFERGNRNQSTRRRFGVHGEPRQVHAGAARGTSVGSFRPGQDRPFMPGSECTAPCWITSITGSIRRRLSTRRCH